MQQGMFQPDFIIMRNNLITDQHKPGGMLQPATLMFSNAYSSMISNTNNHGIETYLTAQLTLFSQRTHFEQSIQRVQSICKRCLYNFLSKTTCFATSLTTSLTSVRWLLKVAIGPPCLFNVLEVSWSSCIFSNHLPEVFFKLPVKC